MENKTIIIILIIIIVILSIVVGAMFLLSANAKEPTKIKITSDKTQYEGGKLSIQLTDFNKTPITKEIVNITVTNSKGKVVVDDVVKTDSKGKANLDLSLKKGKYTVNVAYGGNENYTGNNTTQKLSIKEAETIVQSTESSQTATSTESDYDPYAGMYEEYPDGEGGTVHKFNWVGMTEYDYDDGYYVYEYDDGHVESGYYPGHGP